jgi:hypothetical protein
VTVVVLAFTAYINHMMMCIILYYVLHDTQVILSIMYVFPDHITSISAWTEYMFARYTSESWGSVS